MTEHYKWSKCFNEEWFSGLLINKSKGATPEQRKEHLRKYAFIVQNSNLKLNCGYLDINQTNYKINLKMAAVSSTKSEQEIPEESL